MKRDYVTVIGAGIIVALAALLLVYLGNPANTGLCIACFERDIAAALGLHDFRQMAWLRPEIPGILLGALAAAVATREFRPTAGSAPATRFLLGMMVAVGAMAFLGCPTRMALRIAGGDLNAVVGLAGFVAGIAIGVRLLVTGFNLGRASTQWRIEALILPVLMLALVVLAAVRPMFKPAGPIFMGTTGYPGCAGTPVGIGMGVVLCLAAGVVVGIVAQRARLCFVGGIRDFLLIRSGLLLAGFGTVVAVALTGNLVLGRFHPGFANQPMAHTAHAWNFLGMALVGLASVLLGGCPFRQLVLAGSGSGDAAVAVLGMTVGAALAHNCNIVKAASPYGKAAVVACLCVAIVIGWINRDRQE